jgi:hypothetical protein
MERSNIKQLNDKKISKIILRLDITKKKDKDEFLFIQKKIKEERVQKGLMKLFVPLKKTDVIRSCIKMVYKHYINLNLKKIQELKEIKKSIIKDKMKLYSDDE